MTKVVRKRSFGPLPGLGFVVLGMLTLATFVLLPVMFPASVSLLTSSLAMTEAPQASLSLDGAAGARLSGEVTCGASAVRFVLAGASGYEAQLLLTSQSGFDPAAGHVYSLDGGAAGLELNLLSEEGAGEKGASKTVTTFTATSGNVSLTNGKGLLRAVLQNGAGEQVHARASWTCP